MAQFQIEYGIGGGYNVNHKEVIEADNLDEAQQIAYEQSVEVFESYNVFGRQNNVDDFEDEDDCQAAYDEEVDRWCSYSATPI